MADETLSETDLVVMYRALRETCIMAPKRRENRRPYELTEQEDEEENLPTSPARDELDNATTNPANNAPPPADRGTASSQHARTNEPEDVTRDEDQESDGGGWIQSRAKKGTNQVSAMNAHVGRPLLNKDTDELDYRRSKPCHIDIRIPA